VKLTRDQAWELRKLQGARRHMVKTRLYYIKNMDLKMEEAAIEWISDLDKEIAALEALRNS
jgi:hypothetical protein